MEDQPRVGFVRTAEDGFVPIYSITDRAVDPPTKVILKSPTKELHYRLVAEGETFLDRLKVEREDLFVKCSKLEAFIDTPAFNKLERNDRNDLQEQLHHMMSYAGILAKRLDRIDARH